MDALRSPVVRQSASERPLAHSKRGLRDPLFRVLLAAFVLRLIVFGIAYYRAPDLHTLQTPDSESYIKSAQGLAATGTFSCDGQPEFLRTPGYPLMMVPGVWLGHVEATTVAFQFALSLATVWLIYRTARLTVGDERVGLIAAWLYAIEPLSVFFTSFLMTETLFTFLIVVFWHESTRYFQNHSVKSLCGATLMLVACAYVRPVSLYLPIPIFGILLVRALWQQRERWRFLAHAAAFAGICAALLGAWEARNYFVAGYRGFTGIADYNMYYYQQAIILARHSGKTLKQTQYELGQSDPEEMFARHPQWRNLSMPELLHAMGAEGKAVVSANRWEYAKVHLGGIPLTLLGPGKGDFLDLWGIAATSRSKPIGAPSYAENGILHSIVYVLTNDPLEAAVSVIVGVMMLGYYFFGFAGLAWRTRRLSMSEVVQLATCCYFVAICAGPGAIARYRHPVMPFLAFLASYGVVCFLDSRSRWQSRSGAAILESTRPVLLKHAA